LLQEVRRGIHRAAIYCLAVEVAGVQFTRDIHISVGKSEQVESHFPLIPEPDLVFV